MHADKKGMTESEIVKYAESYKELLTIQTKKVKLVMSVILVLQKEALWTDH